MRTPPSSLEIETIYRRLIRGLGHELVNDDNVDALVRRAQQDEHTVLVQELREWQMSCGPSGGMPSTIAPTPGFNREHVKR